jgi:hypothetical protein
MQPSAQVYRTNQATLKSHEFESFGDRAKILAKKARISRGRAVRGVKKRIIWEDIKSEGRQYY